MLLQASTAARRYQHQKPNEGLSGNMRSALISSPDVLSDPKACMFLFMLYFYLPFSICLAVLNEDIGTVSPVLVKPLHHYCSMEGGGRQHGRSSSGLHPESQCSMLKLCKNWVILKFLWLLKSLLVFLVTSLGNFCKGGSLKWLVGLKLSQGSEYRAECR